MRVITGDETGLLKLVNLSNRQYLTFLPSNEQQTRSMGIRDMSWNDEFNMFSLVRVNGMIESWVTHDNSLSCVSLLQMNLKNPVGILCRKELKTITVYGEDGGLHILQLSDTNCIDILSTSQTMGPLNAGASCSNGLAFGGKENDLFLLDANTLQNAWTARNVPHDNLNLRVPIWITAIQFESDLNTTSNAKIVTGTGYKHVRLYDVQAQRRPVISLDIGDFRVTSVSMGDSIGDRSSNSFTVYVGDTSGGFTLWDLRTQKKLHALKGCAGSIRSIQMHPSHSAIGCAGLDRFVRVYSTKTFKQISAAYLKNRLNCCLFMNDTVDMECMGGRKDLNAANSSSKKRLRQFDVDAYGDGGDDMEGSVGNGSTEDYVEDYVDSDDEDGGDEEDDDDDEGDEEEDEGDGGDEEDCEEDGGDEDDSSSDDSNRDSSSKKPQRQGQDHQQKKRNGAHNVVSVRNNSFQNKKRTR